MFENNFLAINQIYKTQEKPEALDFMKWC